MNTVLSAVIGSTAYGLATSESDIDRLAVWVAPTEHVLSLDWDRKQETVVTKNPDMQAHEVGKYIRLLMGGNPTLIELLWADQYDALTGDGQRLIEARSSLIGTETVRKSYIGYAKGQAERLARRHADGKEGFNSDLRKRTRKHGRHCWRLVVAS